jgi:hypothetical protein
MFLLGWVLQSIIWAVLLYQFGIPGAWVAIGHCWWRMIPALAMAGIIVFVSGWSSGVMFAIAGFAVLEFYHRKGNWKVLGSAVPPWAYLAFGIQLALYFSSVIVSVRACTEYDSAFARIDKLLMFGGTVTGISRDAVSLYGTAEFLYYSIGGVMGAAILFLCLSGERQAAFQMCGAILTAYYISLVLFFLLPAQGPFISAGLPPGIATATVQRMSLVNATILYHHTRWITPPLGYYVAFPSLHVAQPVIAAWFLRRWSRVCMIVGAYCVLLVPAILILQWHYVIDIIGGLFVAAIAVWLASGCPVRHETKGSEIHSFA